MVHILEANDAEPGHEIHDFMVWVCSEDESEIPRIDELSCGGEMFGHPPAFATFRHAPAEQFLTVWCQPIIGAGHYG